MQARGAVRTSRDSDVACSYCSIQECRRASSRTACHTTNGASPFQVLLPLQDISFSHHHNRCLPPVRLTASWQKLRSWCERHRKRLHSHVFIRLQMLNESVDSLATMTQRSAQQALRVTSIPSVLQGQELYDCRPDRTHALQQYLLGHPQSIHVCKLLFSASLLSLCKLSPDSWVEIAIPTSCILSART